MDILQSRLVVAIAAGVIALTGSPHAQAPEPGSDYSAEDWPFVGGDQSSSRYSTLTEISTDTIDRLGAAWVTRLDGGGSSRSTPVVKDGVLAGFKGSSQHVLAGVRVAVR